MQTRCSSVSPPLPAENVATAAQCHWSPEDEERMIHFLLSKKDAAADGANFKSSVWTGLVIELAKHHKKGGPKTAAASKSKYARVCTVLDSLIFKL